MLHRVTSPPSEARTPSHSLSPSSKDRKKARSSTLTNSNGGASGPGPALVAIGKGSTSVAMAQSASGGTSASGVGRQAGGGGALDEGEENEKGGKNKDLSHVPCRFFKVGACQAGASCPFSHSAPEPGQQKQVCQWYLKGNCRFGHKCALAHLKPGEPPIMDRKNKKAAQLAAQGRPLESTNTTDDQAFPLPSGSKPIASPSRRVEKAHPPGAEKVSIGTGAGQEREQSRPQALPAGRSYSDMAKATKSPPVKGSLSMTKPVETFATGADAGRPHSKGETSGMPGAMETSTIAGTPDTQAQDIETTPQASSSEWKRVPFISGTVGASPYPLYMPQPSGIAQTIPTPAPYPLAHPYSGTIPLTVPGPIASFRRTSTFEGAHQPYRNSPIGTPPNDITFPIGSHTSGSPFSAPGSRGVFPSSFTERSALPRPPLTSGSSGGFLDQALLLSSPGAKLFSSSVVGGEFGQMGRDIWGQRSFSARLPSTTSPPMGSASVRPLNDNRRYSEFGAQDGSEDGRRPRITADEDEDDDQGEEFLPSSLNELLTPRERARRLSRQDSNLKSGSVGIAMGWPQATGSQADQVGGRSSALSSSWDTRPDLLDRQAQSAGPSTGTFMQGLWDDEKPESRVLGQDNPDRGGQARPIMGEQRLSAGSLAFLPNLLQPGGKRSQPLSLLSDQAFRPPASAGLTAHSPSRPSPLQNLTQMEIGGNDGRSSGLSAGLGFVPGAGVQSGAGTGLTGIDIGGTGNLSYLAAQSSIPPVHQLSPLSTYANPHAQHLQSAQHLQQVPSHPLHPSNNLLHTHNQALSRERDRNPDHLSLSPGTKALQSHAPGQSLPQGLAAGLSRLHLMPRKLGIGSGLGNTTAITGHGKGESDAVAAHGSGGQAAGLPKRSDGDEDDLFDMES